MSTPKPIEFRLLQLQCNPVGDERLTVALVHFDGTEVRFAWNRSRVPPALAHLRNDVNDALDILFLRLRPFLGSLHLPVGLDHMLQVQEGFGSLLIWGPLQRGMTIDSAAHYDELGRMLELRAPEQHRKKPQGLSYPQVAKQFLRFSEHMKSELGSTDRVQTNFPIKGLREYESPLSWLNGKWHHSFPLNLTRVRAELVVEKYERALGHIDVCVPAGDVGVIIAVFPEKVEIQHEIKSVEEFVLDRFDARVECVRAPLVHAREPSFDALKSRIEHDVMTGIQKTS